MRIEWKVMAGIAAVLAPWAVVYWVFSYEPAGTAALVLTTVGFAFMAVYLAVQSRQVGLRPEDRDDATVAEGAADLGLFPTASPWPVIAAVATTVMAYGVVFSGWILLPGFLLLVTAVAGMAVEGHRGS